MDFIENLQKASKIHNNIKNKLTNSFIENNSIYNIANFIESEIEIENNNTNQLNNGIAFPVGISIDNIVAHYTPSKKDKDFFISKDSILKIDYGVHNDGYIIDSAFSINLDDSHKSICDASKDAIENVIKNIGVETKFQELSSILEEVVKSYEYEYKGILKPVKIIDNVYGHNIKPYSIHGGKFLYPTIHKDDNQIVEENEIMAIEVFTSNGFGKTKLDDNLQNYSHYKLKNEFLDRNIPLFPIKKLNLIGDLIKETFGSLPFCPKFINKIKNDINVTNTNMQSLFNFNIVESYPPLLEYDKNSKTAQYEHTICVTNNGVIDFNE